MGSCFVHKFHLQELHLFVISISELKNGEGGQRDMFHMVLGSEPVVVTKRNKTKPALNEMLKFV